MHTLPPWHIGLTTPKPLPTSRQAQTCWACAKAYLRAPEETAQAFVLRRLCLNCFIYTHGVVYRACLACGGYFKRRRAEGRPTFSRRHYCGRRCGALGSRAPRAQAIWAHLKGQHPDTPAPPGA